MKTEELFLEPTTYRYTVSNAPEADFDAGERVSRALAIPDQFSGDMQALDEKVKSMMETSNNMIRDGKTVDGTPRRRKAFICKVCGKEDNSTHIRDHIEANHLEGISIPCDYCFKIFRSRDSLKNHKGMFHK